MEIYVKEELVDYVEEDKEDNMTIESVEESSADEDGMESAWEELGDQSNVPVQLRVCLIILIFERKLIRLFAAEILPALQVASECQQNAAPHHAQSHGHLQQST